MNRVRVIGVFVVCAAMAAPAAADVTLKQKVTGKGMVASSGESMQVHQRHPHAAGSNDHRQ